MAREEDNKKKKVLDVLPGHQQVILGGLARYKYFSLTHLISGNISNIISTTLLIPLDVFQYRLRYPDTWCCKMFRIMVNCKGCPGPYEVLSARMLQKRTFASLKWGIYYCRFVDHKRACTAKGLNPVYQTTFLLTGRSIVVQAVEMGTGAEVRDFVQERKWVQEKRLLAEYVQGFNSQVRELFASVMLAAMTTDWPMDAFRAAIIASALLHPLDVFKVRIQLYPEAWGLSLLRSMLRCEGIRAPYMGLGASILRQTTYTTTRLGTYSCLYDNHKRMFNNTPSFYNKLSMGACAGVTGAFVGCPAEIVLVRMMADGPVDPYRRYRNVVDAIMKMWRTEGFCSLWRGAVLTMSKSAVISVSQIGTYSQARNYLVEKNRARGFYLHLYTSLFSSFVTALITLPLDTFKTRYQVVSTGTHRDIYQKFRQDSGVLGLWRGFTPYYLRLAVHTLVTFYLLETFYGAHRKKNKTKTEP